ncbi:MAG: hypothetical protein II552_00385 [Bacteroidales bacterium]|nr:hypothetical protein [Bacteroidales bacterium]
MKRTLLLLLLFLALVGGGILALTLSSGGSGKKIVLEEASGADAIESRIIHEWSIATGWDKTLYNDLKDEIQMSLKAELITPTQENQLLELNCARASLVIVPQAEEEFKKADCNRGVISRCSDGISTLRKDGFSNADTKRVGNCCSVYFQILKLIESSCVSGFQVGGNQVDWKDYREYVSEQEEQVQSFQSNDTYRTYLSRITVLKEGLADRKEAVRKGAQPYYSGVCQEFKTYFSGHPGLDSDILKSAAVRFRQQVSSFPGCATLAGELDRYVESYH